MVVRGGRSSRRTLTILALAASLMVAAVLALPMAVRSAEHRAAPAAARARAANSTPGPMLGEALPVEAGVHIPPGQHGHWVTDPPASGQHWIIPNVAPAAWGFTTADLPPEVWLHNLEHGGIVILYNCPEGCEQELQEIQQFIAGAPAGPSGLVKLLDAPYPVPGQPIAIMAWGWRLLMPSWDAALAGRFYLQHIDHGPERTRRPRR